MNPLAQRALIGAGIGGATGMAAGAMGGAEGRGRRMLGYGLGGATLGAGVGAATGLRRAPVQMGASTAPSLSSGPSTIVTAPPSMTVSPTTPAPAPRLKARPNVHDPEKMYAAFMEYGKNSPGSVDPEHVQALLNGGWLRQGAAHANASLGNVDAATRQIAKGGVPAAATRQIRK